MRFNVIRACCMRVQPRGLARWLMGVLASVMVSAAQALSCGTVAAPTACTLASGTVQYTFSGFALGELVFPTGQGRQYTAGEVNVDITVVSGNRMRIRFSKNNSTAGTAFDPGANLAEAFNLIYTISVQRTVAGSVTLDPVFTNAINAVTITGTPFISNQITGLNPNCQVLTTASALTVSDTCMIDSGLTTRQITNRVSLNPQPATGTASLGSIDNLWDAVLTASVGDGIDVDGNGVYAATTDGLLLMRYLLGLRGNALIAGAVGAGATRTTSSQIETYIASLMPLP